MDPAGGRLLRGGDPDRHRPFETQSLFGRVVGHLVGEDRLDLAGVHGEVGGIDDDHVQIAGGGPGHVLEAGEVGLAGESPRQLGRVDLAREDTPRHTFEELLETSLETSGNTHDGRG